MKTLIIASIVVAFACVATVQAGESCAKSACCAEKSAAAAKAKADLAKAKAAASEKGATLLLVKR